MKSSLKTKTSRYLPYIGLEWEKAINNPDSPNFWKFGVADLVFLDHVGDKKMILDLGCGTGGSTLSLACKGKADWIVGIDLSKDMIKVAKKKAGDTGLDNRTCFIVCDGRHLPFKPSSFDGLISRGDAFCFLVPLNNAVQEIRNVMKPGGVIVVEMDNRVDWKPGTTLSTGFQKTREGQIAYLVTAFTKKRNYTSVSYILDPKSKIAKDVANDPEFREKGYKASKCSFRDVKKETIETRPASPTHWPSKRALINLFRRSGFTGMQVMGDGLLMKLLIERDRLIVEAMKKNPQLFFEIEKRLVPYVNPNSAPTMILRAIAP